jgi:hypothetical protein
MREVSMTPFSCKEQWAGAIVSCRINVCTMLNQQLYYRQPTTVGREMKR